MLKELIRSEKKISYKIKAVIFRLFNITYKKLVSKILDFDSILSNKKVKYKAPYKTYLLENDHLIINNGKKILELADCIISKNIITIFGGRIPYEEELNWNKDYVNNVEWEDGIHYSKYTLKSEKPGDIKNVWEMSRFYHLLIIAKAYYLTGNNTYRSYFFEQVKHWDKKNKMNYSVNWTVNMESSIRVINFIEGVALIERRSKLTQGEKEFINNFINKHFIYSLFNLEKGLNSNNHYLTNLAGLSYMLPTLSSSTQKKLLIKGLTFLVNREWIEELDNQIYEDGFTFEDSTSYHVLNLELVHLTYKYLMINNYRVDHIFKKTQFKMANALYQIQSKGNIPLIGDQDNGRLFPLNEKTFYKKTNVQYLLQSVDPHGEIKDKSSPICFNDIGLYVFYNENFKAVFRGGKIGLNGMGGHSHNDQLSLVLNVLNEELFIDPGTATYSGNFELRKKLRSTCSHNTLFIKDYEQNDIDFDIFKMNEKTFSKVLDLGENHILGEHKGYSDLIGKYTRGIKLMEDGLVIEDKIEGGLEKYDCYLSFILSPNVKAYKTGNELLFKLTNSEVLMSWKGIDFDRIEKQLFSNSYGRHSYTNKIILKLTKSESSVEIKIKSKLM